MNEKKQSDAYEGLKRRNEAFRRKEENQKLLKHLKSKMIERPDLFPGTAKYLNK